jgi:hypothetical protein
MHRSLPSASLEATTRLPRGVRPLHYGIALAPDARNARFSPGRDRPRDHGADQQHHPERGRPGLQERDAGAVLLCYLG